MKPHENMKPVENKSGVIPLQTFTPARCHRSVDAECKVGEQRVSAIHVPACDSVCAFKRTPGLAFRPILARPGVLARAVSTIPLLIAALMGPSAYSRPEAGESKTCKKQGKNKGQEDESQGRYFSDAFHALKAGRESARPS